ncbi:MAG: bifunctional (p)ppGpp synthetase/guanosine-3',5'-bis(diphosphate) 3'-pyrophosphohydrolase [Peptostreptococcaceae bacterium]|nr:bifunctional (p)ppGpp synthetase/guanosine-3',5'-bis(diphosphate) 3'-pyrophosphohydrolase [Peptostreptococcaceae bacterium]
MLENLLLMIEGYSPDADLDVVVRAYHYAQIAHEGQYRKSGEKYIVHPVEVAKILAELELDVTTIAAGLLHDVIEDTSVEYADIAERFGKETADIVDGVTKLGQIAFKTKEEAQIENFRKMFIAMSKDMRVILVKLADRLHNMRTLKFQPEEKAKSTAKETLEIFAPIAHRLGISRVKWELEDIALRYLNPEGYYDIVERVSMKRKQREEYIETVIDLLQANLREDDIEAEVKGRAKHFYSIYNKMHKKGRAFEEIYDLVAVRILVNNVKDCYGAMGVVHKTWNPMRERIKDYVAIPKENEYQSIHTTVFGPDGEPLEIQIRTYEMHRKAEFGIAAHWRYKEGKAATSRKDMDKVISWIGDMIEAQTDVSNMGELAEYLFDNQVFVYTPQGDVVELPAGAVPLDFAYKIHSGVGNRYNGAKVNGKIVSLDYSLKNGEVVEIMTASNSNGPSRDWLNIVKSPHSKSKIRQWFKKERREENIEKGREALEREAKKQGYPIDEILKHRYLAQAAKAVSVNSEEDMFAALGYGGLNMSQVFPKLKEKYEEDHPKAKEEKQEKTEEKPRKKASPKKEKDTGVNVKGIDNILIRYAKCCNPLPGDDIVGYITKGRGVSVHREDCPNISRDDVQKRVEVEWAISEDKMSSFEAEIQLRAGDRKGLFMEVSRILGDEKLSVLGINARSNKEGIALMNILLEVRNKDQLKNIINKLKRMPEVEDVARIFN